MTKRLEGKDSKLMRHAPGKDTTEKTLTPSRKRTRDQARFKKQMYMVSVQDDDYLKQVADEYSRGFLTLSKSQILRLAILALKEIGPAKMIEKSILSGKK